MKKIFPRHKFGPRPRIWTILGITALGLFFLLILFNKPGGGAKIIKNSASSSWLRLISSFGKINDLVRARSSLISEIEALREDKNLLEAENLVLNEKLNNSERLASLIGTTSPNKLVAMVQSQFPDGPFDTISIDKGSADGIEVDNEAEAYGVYLGRIIEVGEESSKIRLPSYPGNKIEGFIEKLSLNVSVEGAGGGKMILSIPKNIEISIGDKIFLNSRRATLIGEVDNIKEAAAEPLKDISFRIPLNLGNLRFLTIY